MVEAPNFLLVRLDGIGDALACVPMLEGLARAHPGARFGAVCSPKNRDVFSNRVDRVYVFGGDTTVESLAPELRRGAYTDAIIATEEVAGYALGRAAKARRRAGFWHRFDKPFKSIWQFAQLTDRVYRPAAWTARPEHEVETLYRLATPFGARMPVPRDSAALRTWLSIGASPPGAREALGIQVAGKWTSGGWGPNSLARMFEAMYAASDLPQLKLLAAPGDEGLARSVLEEISPNARNRSHVIPSGGVPEWFAAIDSLAALVTPDTGAAHAAGMLGVPVIDVFDEPRFDQLSRQWRPWAAPQRCVAKPAPAPPAPERFGAELGAGIPRLREDDPRR